MYNVMVISLGCDKNTAESEKMITILESRGYGITSVYEDADVAVVNSCCFIKSATEETIAKLFELAELKQDRLKYIICVGCMAERYKDEISADIPEVDAFLGTSSLARIADVVDSLVSGKRQGESAIEIYDDINDSSALDNITSRIITEHPYMGYLKIAEGCDKRCTYCAIPLFKGRFRSVAMNTLLAETRILAANGVRELILVAQETTSYGVDIYGEKRLHELIHKISEVDGIEWIRLLYAYPEEIYDELITEMSSNPKVLHYIDMPLQHTEDEVLRRMGRRIRKQGIYDVVSRLRAAMPDIAIRSTMITGFPGETREQHEDCLATLDELKLDHVGAFTYSREDGTAAATFEGQVHEQTKKKYMREIMELQQGISHEKNQTFTGKVLDVIIEGYIPEDDVYVGRTYRDAPDVDGLVFIDTDRELMSGEIVPVKIYEASEYDMSGRFVI